jgi:esterase/lipase superfamily enzyme
MFNEELANKIVAQHGRQAAMIYCKIEAMKNRHMSVELNERNIPDWPDEYKHEADWWEKKYKELEEQS